MRLRPDVGLVGADPVGLGLGLQVGHRFGHACQSKQQTPPAADRFQAGRAALIEPGDGRPQWAPLPVYVDHRRTLRGERHAGHRLFGARVFLPELPAGLAQMVPIVFGLLFGPTGLIGKVGLHGHPRLGDRVAAQVEQKHPRALRADVDGKNAIPIHSRSIAPVLVLTRQDGIDSDGRSFVTVCGDSGPDYSFHPISAADGLDITY